MTEKLLPCPFCGGEPVKTLRKYNPFAKCVTPECISTKLPLIKLDHQPDIDEWNRRAAQPSAPDGWKLVPMEPTREMVLAGKRTIKGADTTFEGILTAAAYSSMLAAAPKFGEDE